ncbi:MAG: AI-2E family transporter, partial [Thiohalorhabdaceae bacterium]
GVIYAGGLWLAGLELAFLVGLVAGLVSFVPYLGFILGVVLATAAMLVQTGGDLMALLPVLGVFLVGQVIETTFLTPLLVGDRIGLHPVAVIFAVLAGGQLFGFLGVLLGLPVAAVLAVLVRHAHQHYLASDLYRDTGEEA